MPGRVGCARVVGIDGCEYGPPNGVKRFQTGTEATGPAKDAPELELDAFLQVPVVERLTPYLSAIRSSNSAAPTICSTSCFPTPTSTKSTANSAPPRTQLVTWP